MNPDAALEEMKIKIEELEDLLLALPIRAGVKTQLFKQVADFVENVEDAVHLSPVDW